MRLTTNAQAEILLKQQEDRDLIEYAELENHYLQQVSNSKPLIGYLCLRVPPEYIEASGGVPMRLIPRSGFDVHADSPIRTDGCSFCRTLPAILRLDYYQGLTAIIAGSCCDQMRRVTEVLGNTLPIPVHLYGAPRTWKAEARYFQQEMINAFTEIQKLTGHVPSEEEIRREIKIRNQLKLKIQELRQHELLPTAILHQIAASPLPPETILNFLQRYEKKADSAPKIRLLLAGSIPGVWEIKEFEAHSARIIADATCLGDRVFDCLSAENGDPIAALYQDYVEENDCPHRRPITPLIEYMRSLVKKHAIDGVIYRSIKYCHPWGLAAERIKQELAIPTLLLDDDLTSPAIGNLRTRVGAFVEMLKARRAHHEP